jgi:hypothetical protein
MTPELLALLIEDECEQQALFSIFLVKAQGCTALVDTSDFTDWDVRGLLRNLVTKLAR